MNAQGATRAAVHKLQVARALIDTGMFEPLRPDRTLQSLVALRRWGATPAGAYSGAAVSGSNGAAIAPCGLPAPL